MHDLDRIQLEADLEADSEADGFQAEDEALEADIESEAADYGEGPFTEQEEVELASELLAVSSEADLDLFLGRLIKKGLGKIRRTMSSPAGRALGRMLKGVAKRVLPSAGALLGTAIGGPVGGMLGGKLSSVASKALGLELEGLSYEDQEMAVARRLVQLAGQAAQETAMTEQEVGPAAAAKRGVLVASRRYAPGLLINRSRVPAVRPSGSPVLRRFPAEGRWYRRGTTIILRPL